MGLCGSAESNMTPEEKERNRQEKARSKALEKQAQDDHQKDAAVNKLLLLGAGESGKSTLFKQMIQIYGTGFPEQECRTYEPIIYNNIITSMQALINHSQNIGEPSDGDSDEEKARKEKAKEALAYFAGIQQDVKIDMENVGHFKILWADPCIQVAFDNRSSFQLTDSTEYFFIKIDEIAMDDYLPSERDVLHSRVRTTGIVENNFNIDGNQFKMFDVGGQRNERKKWIHCFENVTAVLFVGVLSEYDQVLYEDETMNRMEETLNLFDEICNSRWFRETSIILFLNKKDIFEEKIKRVPLNVCPVFQHLGDENWTFDSGCKVIEEMFQSKNRNPEKVIYCHVTCATDTTNVAAVFNAVKDIIIRKSLGEAGLV